MNSCSLPSIIACTALLLASGCTTAPHTHPALERDVRNTALVVVQQAEWWDTLFGALEEQGGAMTGEKRKGRYF